VSNVRPVGKHRRATSFRVEFPTIPSLKVRPKIASLIQKQKNHDILVLEYASTSQKTYGLLKTGVPVKFSWRQGSRKMEWVGYVTSASKKSSVQKLAPMKIVCVGASFVLKQRKTKTYVNKTVTEVAAKIAKENNLRFVGEPDSRRFSQLTISGHSQWEWLHEQANRIGYAMYIQGTSLIFRPIDSLLNEQSTNVPLFQLWDPSYPRTMTNLDRTLDSLEVISGENNEDGSPSRAIKQTGGVDPVRGTSFTYKKSPSKSGRSIRTNVSDSLFDEVTSSQVVHSKSDSRYASSGAAQLARFNITAVAFGQGDPRIGPYRLIQVEGSGAETDGQWIVKEAVHKFGFGGTYNVELKIATDGAGQNSRKTRDTSRNTINVNSLLTKSRDSFGVNGNNSSINLAEEMNSAGSWNSTLNPKETIGARLVVKKPLLNKVNNQGFLRTPALWQTKTPSSSSSKTIRKAR
jgi:phage protein D